MCEAAELCVVRWSAAQVPPQGTALSSFLLTLYTHTLQTVATIRSSPTTLPLCEVCQLGTSVSVVRVITELVDWCEPHHLKVNASRTKKMGETLIQHCNCERHQSENVQVCSLKEQTRLDQQH